jgi:hypothetical protein
MTKQELQQQQQQQPYADATIQQLPSQQQQTDVPAIHAVKSPGTRVPRAITNQPKKGVERQRGRTTDLAPGKHARLAIGDHSQAQHKPPKSHPIGII